MKSAMTPTTSFPPGMMLLLMMLLEQTVAYA
jgi:hypothetical protein